MKTQDLKERLEYCQELTSLLQYADERISMRKGFWQQWSEVGSRERMRKVERDIEITERAKQRISDRLSKSLLMLYKDLASLETIYNDCKDTVNSIEGYWYERTTTML